MSSTYDEQANHRIERELEAYDTTFSTYKKNAADLEQRIRTALEADPRIRLHDVSARVKDRSSLERKLLKKVEKDPMMHIEDVIGVRIITYFRDDAPRVEDIVRRILDVHEGSYVNKADMLRDREFGYRSIQFVVTMPWATRETNVPSSWGVNILEPSLSPAVAEIQIRSILEHAWAETQHDLQYHAAQTLSRDVDRRFALTAALVENVDEQLMAIRNEVSDVRDDEATTPEEREEGYIQRIIETDRASRALDEKIANALDLELIKGLKHRREVGRATAIANLHTSSQIREALAEQGGKLGLRMAIVCTDVDHQLILPDTHHHTDDPIAAFPGIGIYWTALALLHRGRDKYSSFNSVGGGRLAEYVEVGRYLVEHPKESALSIRERYRRQAYEHGNHTDQVHELNLGE
ncbi:hypothetical protein [Microbacterium sp. KR10-403]|uniref:GTP pyrophosphokinase n=1 Tax=Microbacterium sp. KR10-403 TaxID=3158581 RepID=UPI0032E51AF8